MSQDNGLPPRPTHIRPKEFDPNAGSLPPLGARSDLAETQEEYLGSLQSDSMDRSSLSKFIDSIKTSTSWTPAKAVAAIFVGSFIFSVLFTSAILAGIIEIHPAAIKSFFKTLVGKG